MKKGKGLLILSLIPAAITLFSVLFMTGCPETWLKEIGGDTYGDIYGIVRDTNSVGINDVNVGLTGAADALDYVSDEEKLIAKCTYLTATAPATDPRSELGDGYYSFERASINMSTAYIVVWKSGYLPALVESMIEKFASTYQLPVVLTKQ